MQCINLINTGHILEPICKFLSPKPSGSRSFQPSSLVVEDDDSLDLLSLSNLKCRVLNLCLSHFATSLYCLTILITTKLFSLILQNQNYVTSYIWANDEAVRESLHIREVQTKNTHVLKCWEFYIKIQQKSQ